jgi:hypothetical protein
MLHEIQLELYALKIIIVIYIRSTSQKTQCVITSVPMGFWFDIPFLDFVALTAKSLCNRLRRLINAL